MQRNGPLALLFHALVVSFMLAPLVIVCLVAFTPQDTLSLPTTGISLCWFKAVFEHPDFNWHCYRRRWRSWLRCRQDWHSGATNFLDVMHSMPCSCHL